MWLRQVAPAQVLRELSIPQFFWDHPSVLARVPSTAGTLSEETVTGNVDVVEDACAPPFLPPPPTTTGFILQDAIILLV